MLVNNEQTHPLGFGIWDLNLRSKFYEPGVSNRNRICPILIVRSLYPHSEISFHMYSAYIPALFILPLLSYLSFQRLASCVPFNVCITYSLTCSFFLLQTSRWFRMKRFDSDSGMMVCHQQYSCGLGITVFITSGGSIGQRKEVCNGGKKSYSPPLLMDPRPPVFVVSISQVIST